MEGSFVTVLVAELADDRLGGLLAEHGGREIPAPHDELTAAFPSAAAVNDVLRTVAGLIREHPPVKRARPRRSA